MPGCRTPAVEDSFWEPGQDKTLMMGHEAGGAVCVCVCVSVYVGGGLWVMWENLHSRVSWPRPSGVKQVRKGSLVGCWE